MDRSQGCIVDLDGGEKPESCETLTRHVLGNSQSDENSSRIMKLAFTIIEEQIQYIFEHGNGKIKSYSQNKKSGAQERRDVHLPVDMDSSGSLLLFFL